jgi:hypothetical protein
MWVYTLYIIYAFITSKKLQRAGDGSIRFRTSELTKFIFDELWHRYHIIFHDNEEDVERDLRVLQGLGLLELEDGNSIILLTDQHLKTVENISNAFKKYPLRNRVLLIDQYFKKIEEVITEPIQI